MFIPSILDDYGLNSPQFRIYAHVARRAGGGTAFSAVANIADHCRLHEQTVRTGLQFLVQQGLLTEEQRPGRTTLYRLAPVSAWLPPVKPKCNPSGLNTPPSVSEATPLKRMETHPSESKGDEGTPIKGTPKKETPYSLPGGDGVTGPDSVSSQVEAIYEAYPKKVGQPGALRAIRRALAGMAAEELLKRTLLYALTCNSPMQFIPNPARWFNEKHFNDDPATWRRTTMVNGKPQPAIVRPEDFGCGVANL